VTGGEAGDSEGRGAVASRPVTEKPVVGSRACAALGIDQWPIADRPIAQIANSRRG